MIRTKVTAEEYPDLKKEMTLIFGTRDVINVTNGTNAAVEVSSGNWSGGQKLIHRRDSNPCHKKPEYFSELSNSVSSQVAQLDTFLLTSHHSKRFISLRDLIQGTL